MTFAIPRKFINIPMFCHEPVWLIIALGYNRTRLGTGKAASTLF